ncbi:MAG: phytoene/squalene synthase family protein [Deltaproteobacteria bacterium]|jgi:15-cis-phytoene synthase|nr:phytoene/squalene synthase family protein [Deltaproteobacteria bacterium]MBT6435531.1 phytoene/squalene synthase family protein [Deltaproteobacteria bacterium]
MTEGNLAVASRDVLAHHARSFRWGAWFLPAGTHDEAAITYAFCRLVDDVVDEAENEELATEGVKQLEAELREDVTPTALVAGFAEVMERDGGSLEPAFELIKGVRSDLGEQILQTPAELLTYCYRVAGTVGLMMCQVLQVKDKRALPHAVDLGIGMQLTNIARDVHEDAGRGRVYIPAQVLDGVGITSAQVLDGTADREKLAEAVEWLYRLGERYYVSAERGMRFIPWRSRLAIFVASRTYRAIGVKLARRKFDAMAGRVVVSWYEKVFWVGHGIFGAFKTLLSKPYVNHRAELHRNLQGMPGCSAR